MRLTSKKLARKHRVVKVSKLLRLAEKILLYFSVNMGEVSFFGKQLKLDKEEDGMR